MKSYRRTSFNWLAVEIHNAAVARHRDVLKGRVIDLGCGTAEYKEDILQWADAYIGVDWPDSIHDDRYVDVMADLSKTFPFKDDYADTLVSFQVMEHLPEPEMFLVECHRVLSPGGQLFLTTPFMWHVHEAPHDYFRYTTYGLRYLLEKAGFNDIRIRPLSGYWTMAVLKFNFYSTRFAKGPLRFLWIPLWWLGQSLAPILDRVDGRPIETVGYEAIATKAAGPGPARSDCAG